MIHPHPRARQAAAASPWNKGALRTSCSPSLPLPGGRLSGSALDAVEVHREEVCTAVSRAAIVL